MVDNEKLTETKEKLDVKREEKILNANEKRTNSKIKIRERVLEKKKIRNEKRIESHLNLADTKIDDALDDAEMEIAVLLEEVDLAIAEDKEHADLIIFKANNYMEEIMLSTQLRIVKIKNQLIRNLEDDLEETLELVALEESIFDLKEKSAVLETTLRGKIEAEKEELKEKYGEE